MSRLFALFIGLSWLCQSPATAADVDDAARAALAERRYAEVVSIYEARPERARSALDRYRLAIAHQALKQPLEAWSHLQAAKGLDPRGSFASSPPRLAALSSAIEASCSAGGHPGCSRASPRPAPLTETTGPSASTSTSPASPTQAVRPPAEQVQVAHTQLEIQPTYETSRVFDPSGLQPLAMWYVGLAVGVGAACLVFELGRRIAQARAHRAQRLNRKSLTTLHAAVAATIAHLAALPARHKSELEAALASLLPLLERETGRVAWRANGIRDQLVSADRNAVELAAALSRAPLDALTADARQVEAMFRRPVI